MIRVAIVFGLLVLFSVAPAQSQAQREPASAVQDTAADETTPAAKAGEQWGDGRARGPRPTKEPAEDEPYNWTFMAYSAGAMLVMLAFVVWLVRRSRRRGN